MPCSQRRFPGSAKTARLLCGQARAVRVELIVDRYYGWLRRMCVSGLLGVQAAQVQVQRFDTGSVSVRRERQRMSTAIVETVYAPGLASQPL